MNKNHTMEEVAERFRTTTNTVAYWVAIGKLHGFKVGRRRLFTSEELDAFEAAAQQEAATPR